jgi:hypothetical protein
VTNPAYRELTSLNNVTHVILSGTTNALCGAHLTRLFPHDPQHPDPMRCTVCTSKIAKLLRQAATQ